MRLLRLFIAEICKRKPTSEDLLQDTGIDEAFRGLLRHRGFSFQLPSDILMRMSQGEFQVLRQAADLQALLPDDLQRTAELLDQDIPFVLKLNGILPSEEELEKQLSAFVGRGTEVKRLTAVYRDFGLAVSRYAEALDEGRHSRKAYLSSLADRISSDSRLVPIVNLIGGSERLAKLIGNVSNLPLKTLRQCFNPPDMATGDRWDHERVRRAIISGVLRQRPTNDSERRVRQIVLKDLSRPPRLHAAKRHDQRSVRHASANRFGNTSVHLISNREPDGRLRNSLAEELRRRR